MVRTSDESTDKIEDKVVWLRWNSQDLLTVFAKRIETFYGNEFPDPTHSNESVLEAFGKVLEKRFKGQGKWSNAPIHRILVSLQRNRPRDLVKLLGAAAKDAYQHGSQLILTQNLQNTFAAYSAERLQDIVNEFGTEMPEIKRVLLAIKPTTKEQSAGKPFLFTQDELDKNLNSYLDKSMLGSRMAPLQRPDQWGNSFIKSTSSLREKLLMMEQ